MVREPDLRQVHPFTFATELQQGHQAAVEDGALFDCRTLVVEDLGEEGIHPQEGLHVATEHVEPRHLVLGVFDRSIVPVLPGELPSCLGCRVAIHEPLRHGLDGLRQIALL